MRTFAKKQNQPAQSSSANITTSHALRVGALTSSGSHFAHDFSRVPVHPSATTTTPRVPSDGDECAHKLPYAVQAKLVTGADDDPLESEANGIANEILSESGPPAVHVAAMRTGRFGERATDGVDAPASVESVLAGVGRPLSSTLRKDMEDRFAHDFSRVRVHYDAEAQESARDMHAHAYTVGQDIVFGARRFSPETREGRRLLAHELTHVVQQSSGGGILADRPILRDPLDDQPPPRSTGLTKAERDKIARARASIGLPRRPTRSKKTLVGILITPTGEEFPLKSGNDDGPWGGPARGGIPRGEGEAFTGGGHSQGNIATHVEGKAAARMHQLNISQATLLVERQPCEVCDDPERTPNITVALPPGAKLTIVDPEATGYYESVQLPPARSSAAPTTPTPPRIVPTGAGSGETEVTHAGDTPSSASGSSGRRMSAGRGAIVPPIVSSGPPARRLAVADALSELAEFGNRLLSHFADQKQQELAQEAITRHINRAASLWATNPEQGLLLTVNWEVWHHGAGDVRRFIDVTEKLGLTEALARRTEATGITEHGDPKADNPGDEIWIDPPVPEAVHQLPTPFRRVALATFAGSEEVQDVKWRGRSTFDDAGFTALKPEPGVAASFFVLQPPSEITFRDGRTSHTTSVPILHRDAPGGWRIPVVNLDTIVGYIPGVDRDTAALVSPADGYTAALFAASNPVNTSQLRLYDFQNVRFVSPDNIKVLQSLSETDVSSPQRLESSPQEKAAMDMAITGTAARELWARLSARGRGKGTPEFLRQFLSLLPADLTMAEMEILSAIGDVETANLSEEELLEAWREAIGRLRSQDKRPPLPGRSEVPPAESGEPSDGDEDVISVSASDDPSLRKYNPTRLGFKVVAGVERGQFTGQIIRVDRAALIKGKRVTLTGVEVVVRKRIFIPNRSSPEKVEVHLEVTRDQHFNIENAYGEEVVKAIGYKSFRYEKGDRFRHMLRLSGAKDR
jgi:hypothetical protein